MPEQSTGPSTDIQVPAQFPTATRIEDGVAYDASGKTLGQVSEAAQKDEPLDLSAGLVPKKSGDELDLSAGLVPKPPAPEVSYQDENTIVGGNAHSLGLPKNKEELIAAGKPSWGSLLLGPAYDGAQGLWGYATRVAGNLHDDVKNEIEAVQNVREGGPIGQNAGKFAYSIAHGVAANLPFVGEGLEKMGVEDIPQGHYRHAGGEALGTLEQTLLPELIGKYVEAHPTQARVRANTLKLAVDDHMAASSVHQTATGDLNAAHAQVNDFFDKLEKAKQAEAAGQGTRQQVNEVQNGLSEAAANLQRSKDAVAEAAAKKAEAAVKIEKAQRDIVNAALPKTKGPKIGTPEEIVKSHADFQKAIPSGPGKSAYTPEDLKAVRPLLENSHLTDSAVNSPEAVYDALENQRSRIEERTKAAVEQYKNEPLKLTGEDGNPASVKQKVVEALKEQESVRPGFTEEALKVLDDYNLTDPSVGEADKIRKQLNTENRTKLQTNHWSIMDAVDSDPEFAAKYELQGIMRDGVYDLLVDKKVLGAREGRNLEASAIRVRNAADRMIPKSDVTVRGTEAPGRFRKALAWGAKKLGAGAGAAAGVSTGVPGAAEAGAIGGQIAGEALAEKISPGARTRSQLIQDSMAVRHTDAKVPQIDMTGAQPSNPPAFPLPPEHEIPVNPRENSQLHSDLASHYDEAIGDTPYNELEDRFLSDVKIKRKYGVPLDPAEKKLNRSINEAKVEEAKAARGETEAQIKKAEQQKAEAERIQKEAEKEKAEKEAAGLNTNVQAPFETGEDLELPERYAKLGYTGPRLRAHELGHQILVDEFGHSTGDVISHLHDENEKGALGQARWDKSQFQDENGKFTIEKIREKLPEILAIFLGGPVVEEVVHGVLVERNPGANSDFARARELAKRTGLSPAETGMVLKAAERTARDILTAPGVKDIIQKYTEHREAGLDDGLHMQPETVGMAVQEARDARGGGSGGGNGGSDGKANNKSGVLQPNEGRVGKSDSGGKGGAKSGAAKAVQAPSEEGAGAGSSGSGERGLKTNAKSSEEIKPSRIKEGGKDFFEQKYPKSYEVKVTWPDGDSHIDEIKGLNEGHAISRAKGNWEGADIEVLRETTPNKAGGPQGGERDLEREVETARNQKLANNNTDEKLTGEFPLTPEAALEANRKIFKGVREWTQKHFDQLPAEKIREGFKSPTAPVITDIIPELKGHPDIAQKLKDLGFDQALQQAAAEQHHARSAADLRESGLRTQVASTAEETKYHPDLQKVIDQNELVSSLPNHASFITPDGKFVKLGGSHPEAIEAATGDKYNDVKHHIEGEAPPTEDNRIKFLDDTGAVRTRLRQGRGGTELTASVPKRGVTPEQAQALRSAVGKMGREGNFYIERADATPENPLYSKKEFPRVMDVDGMLRDIQAHPEQGSLKGNELSSAANNFNKERGRPAVDTRPVSEDPRSSAVADAYKDAVHSPDDPAVKASYDALKRDVKDQYHLAKKLGIDMDVKAENPYGLSGDKPAHEELHNDVRDNKHLSVWSGGAPPPDHPLSAIDPETGHTYNELFRMVHDIFGHAAEKNDFSPAGEESAWNLHRQMFSSEARPALATETKGQAAYTYKYGDFPPQKAAILPSEFHAPAKDWANDVASNLDKQPAGGINPQNPDAPSKRYGFEILPEARRSLEANPTAQDLQDYAREHGDKLGLHPDIKLGWDTTGEKPELNIGASTDDLATAKQMAAKLDQRALWDNKAEKEIPAGGTGKKTAFPEYPLQDRLNDLKKPLDKTHKGVKQSITNVGLEAMAGKGG